MGFKPVVVHEEGIPISVIRHCKTRCQVRASRTYTGILTMTYPCCFPVSAEYDNTLWLVLVSQSRAKISQKHRESALWTHGAWHEWVRGLPGDEHRGPVPKEESGDFLWSRGERVQRSSPFT